MHNQCLWITAALVCLSASLKTHAQATADESGSSSSLAAPPESAGKETPATADTETSAPAEATATAAASDNEAVLLIDNGEVFDDPELSDSPATASPIDSDAGAFVPTGDVRMVLQSRAGVDFMWRDAREDVAEATQIMLLETRLRRSESLRFVTGLRARHQIATRREGTTEAEAVRHSLDVAPTAAYADITVSDGVHVRAGYQVTRIGRFDLFSATNMLAVADLRSGAVSMPDAVDVAQPAIRMDWDATPWLNIQAIHVPFFQPHIVDLVEGDYAMFKTTQADIDAALDGIVNTFASGGSDEPLPPLDCDGPTMATDQRCTARALIRGWWRQIARSGNAGLASGVFGAFGNSPSFANPQGSLRATARSALGELSVTVGTALEHLPSLYIDKGLQSAMRPGLSDMVRGNRLASVTRPFDIEYNRYWVISTDGAMPLGPLQLGAELAYMFDRTLYSAQTECAGPGNECVFYLPTPEQTDMLHAALRIELAQDEHLLIGLELFVATALDDPTQPDNHAWLTLADGRYMTGAALMARWAPIDTGWTFELSSAALNGPTFTIMPRVQLRAAETLFVELGAVWVEGPKPDALPGNGNFAPGTTATADWAIGGLYSNVDQVFAGLKWMP